MYSTDTPYKHVEHEKLMQCDQKLIFIALKAAVSWLLLLSFDLSAVLAQGNSIYTQTMYAFK